MRDQASHKTSGGVPPVADLRHVAQGEKIRGDRRWSYRLFRRISVYVTWVLLHTNVTPNQVTVASLLIAGFGLVLVAVGSPWIALGGYALLLMYHLLDRVDGEIARFREVFSLRGIYLDNAGHYLTGAGIFLATTYRYAPDSSEPQMIWLVGVIGGFAAVMSRVEKHVAFQLFSQYVLENPGLTEGMSSDAGAMTRSAAREDRADRPGVHDRGIVATARNAALTLTSFPVVLAALAAGLLVEIVTATATVAIGILIAAALLQAITYLALEVANVTQNLDAETVRLVRLVSAFRRSDERNGEG